MVKDKEISYLYRKSPIKRPNYLVNIKSAAQNEAAAFELIWFSIQGRPNFLK